MAILGRWCGRVFICLALLTAFSANAAELKLAEQKIKAGMLYNFLKYTQWPADSTLGASPKIMICLYGGEPLDGNLRPLQGRSVNQREITLQSISELAATKECHLIFVNAAKRNDWPQLREALAGKSVLTVSDFSGFASSGGMIEFDKKDEHVSAGLNLEAVGAARLTVEDRLLRLVTIIRSGAEGR